MTLRSKLQAGFNEIQANFFAQSDLADSPFESEYLSIRQKENRLYTDKIVRRLPEYDGDQSLEIEWQLRKASMGKWLNYLQLNKNLKNVLELGCGNGWLSKNMSISGSREIIAMDINRLELEQGARIFIAHENLTFLFADIFKVPITTKSFDCIVLASSFQYFPDPRKLLTRLLELLTDQGEIHIFDSPIYDEAEIAKAKERSEKYFKNSDSGLGKYYFHPSWSNLAGFNVVKMRKPRRINRLIQKFLPPQSPFPWIRISK